MATSSLTKYKLFFFFETSDTKVFKWFEIDSVFEYVFDSLVLL